MVPMVLAGKVSAYDLNAALVARGSTEGSQQLTFPCREVPARKGGDERQGDNLAIFRFLY